MEIGASKFNVTKSVRIDSEMAKELEFIAIYERGSAATLMRMWTQDKILAYKQNPKYKHWRKELKDLPHKG